MHEVDGEAQEVDGVVRAEGAPNNRVATALVAASTGSRDALSYLFCVYAEGVMSRVNTVLRNEDEAETITRSVFSAAIARIGDDGAQTPRSFERDLLRAAEQAAGQRVRQQQAAIRAKRRGSTGQPDQLDAVE